MMKIFYPRCCFKSFLDVKPSFLKSLGIKAVLVDLDNTIVRRDAAQFTPQAREWVMSLLSEGLKVAIISNNSRRRVGHLARQVGVPAVHRAVKPLSAPFKKALALLGTKPGETALVGDQIFTDILGGNLAGLYTILVEPLPGKEFLGTRLINRPLEKLVLARIKKSRLEVKNGAGD